MDYMGEIPKRKGNETFYDTDRVCAVVMFGLGFAMLVPATGFLITGWIIVPVLSVICCLAIAGSIPLFIVATRLSRRYTRERAALVPELKRLDRAGLFDDILIRSMNNADIAHKIELLKSKDPAK